MKNPLKSRHRRHLFCWVQRVYGIQNDSQNLRINKFLMVFTTMHCSRRYLQFFDLFFYLFWKYIRLQCVVFKPIKNRLILPLFVKFFFIAPLTCYWLPGQGSQLSSRNLVCEHGTGEDHSRLSFFLILWSTVVSAIFWEDDALTTQMLSWQQDGVLTT